MFRNVSHSATAAAGSPIINAAHWAGNSSADEAAAGYLETHPELQLFFAVILSLTAALGIFGNILLITTVAMTRILRTPSNMFIANLAVADLVVTTIVDPFNVIGAFVGPAYFAENYTLCQMIASLCAPACLCSMFSICAISVNRYIMICHYHRYDRMFTWEKTTGMCLCIWLLSYCLHFPNHVGWGHNDFDPTFYVCTFSIATHSYAVFYISIGVFVPLVVVLFSYASIFHRYWQVKRDIRRRKNAALEMHNGVPLPSPSVVCASGTDPTSRLQVPLIPSTTLRWSPSNGSVSPSDNSGVTVTSVGNGSAVTTITSSAHLHCQKKGFTSDDIKLAKTLFTVFIAFLVCWSPFSLLVLMKQPKYIPGWIYMMAIIMAHGNSSINAILYGLTNEKFRQGYLRVLGFYRKFPLNSTSYRSGSRPRQRDSTLRRKPKPPYLPPPATSAPLSSLSVVALNGKPTTSGNKREPCTEAIATVKSKTYLRPDRALKKSSFNLSVSDQLLSPNGIIIVVPDSP